MPTPASRDRHRCRDCRLLLATCYGLILICLITVAVSQSYENIFSIQDWLIKGLSLRHCVPTKKAVPGKHSIENMMFTRKLLLVLFLSTAWTLLLYILLSSDVHPNPGPESLSSQSTSTTSQDLSFFENNLSIVHLNIQSLLPKIDILDAEMQHYDILVFTETWLSSRVSNEEICITNFDPPYRNDRENRLGGGVAIYVRTGLQSARRSELIHGGIEAVCIEITMKRHKLLVCGIYRPPDSGNNYFDLIENTLDNMSNSLVNDQIILGDFNCDMLASRSKMKHIASLYNLHQLIDEPTHFTEHSASIIDLIFVTKPEHVIYSGVSSPFINDLIRYHCPTLAVLKYRKVTQTSFKRHIWLYDKGDYLKFRNKLSQITWDEILASNNVDECAIEFSKEIMQAAKETIPNKTVTIRPSEPQWLNGYVKRQIRQRKRLFKIAKRKNTDTSWQKFRQKRNEVVATIRNAKKSYNDKLVTDLISNSTSSKKWFKLTSQLLTTNSDKKPIPFLETNDTIAETDSDKAEILNNFFTNQTKLDDSNSNLPLFQAPSHEILDSILITDEDVREAIGNLKPNKAPGPDLISPKLLKEGIQQLTVPLRKLFNLSLAKKKFPTDWKKANVTAVHKNDSLTDPSNFRPISLLNYNGKLMERCVHKHMTNYLIKHSIISPFQSGFQSGDSAVNQLLHLCNEFSKALDDGKEIRVVFCDITKAFDRVWHRGLLFKLRSIGISGSLLDWISDYLQDRIQRVCVKGSLSSWKKIFAGVPQGSILGPLLFLIFINDIVNNIGTNIRLFADDTSLYHIVEDPLLAAIILNSALSNIFSWAKQWLVDFHPQKTESLVITKKRDKPVHPQLYMGNTSIKEVVTHKHLGVVFTNDMLWHSHIKNITDKAFKRLGILRRHKFYLDRRSLTKMYTTFVRPLLEYADITWDNCTFENQRALENIQIDAARIISGATKLCSIQKLYDETGIETLRERRKKHKLCQLFKMVNGLTPPYLQVLLPQRVQQQSRYSLRNSNNFALPPARTALYYNSFLPSTLREWNSLEQDTRDSATLCSFKWKLSATRNLPPVHFDNVQVSRKAQILHSRLRLECSSLNQHLYKKNLVDNPLCSCGIVESTSHFLLSCARYNHIRQYYFSVLQYPRTKLTLLNGISSETAASNNFIFKQVQLYILATKRFD